MKKEDLKIGWYLADADTKIPHGSRLEKTINDFVEHETANNEELYNIIMSEAEVANVQPDQITHYDFLSTINMIIHSEMHRKFIEQEKFWVDGLYFNFLKPIK